MKYLLAFLLTLLATGAAAGQFTGRVVQVTDGDTLVVQDAQGSRHTVRLGGIDAPEKDQPCGHEARESLVDLVKGQKVSVESWKIDKYGRKIGKLTNGERDFNLEQVVRGYAWHYKRFEAEQSPADRDAYADAEVHAQERSVGLWGCGQVMPPWDWRNREKPVSDAVSQPKRRTCFSDNPAFCDGGATQNVNGVREYYERVAIETAPSSSSERLSNGDYQIHTGPRGGKFHYSISGKKVYQKR